MTLRLPLLATGVLALAFAARLPADDKKDDKKGEEARKGTVTGVVTAKGDNWIEVKADGEEKARKYVPHWRGGNPNQGGGPDKEMVAKLKEVPLKSRVRLEWVFEERPRVVKIEVLHKGDGKDDEQRKGTVTGIVTAKGDNWIEVKADGEEKARRYVPYYRPADKGFDKEVMKVIKEVPLKSRVRLEWSFHERPRAEKIEVLKKGDGHDAPADGKRSGTISGEIKSKKERNNNVVIEVLAPGEEKPRPYFVQYDPKIKGPIPEVLKAVKAAQVGDKVVFDWEATGHGPAIVKFEVTKKGGEKK